jgi:pyruvate dehydrogenase E2 component (dihydrolipoamide acetyltransferase)
MAPATLQDVVMPRLSDSMEEGTILTWLKQVGEEVAIGDEIVEIETDKANMAYETDVAGTLVEILAQEGATLPIGSPIAVIGDPDKGSGRSAAGPVEGEGVAKDEGQGPAGEDVASFSDPAPRPPQASPAEIGEGRAGGERVKASPIARRLAKERGIDLGQLSGSGPGGRIVKADVEGAGGAQAAPAEAPAAAPVEAAETAKGETAYEDLSKLQQVVARRMAESKATAPHFYLSAEIDMSAAVVARSALKAAAGEGEVVPSFNDMVVKACALALREQPKANGAYRDGRFELYSRVNVGLAVAAQGALVVPTIFDADKKGLRQLAEDARALAGKVRDGSITPPELAGGTFTVSNLGMFGIDDFAAVVNSPQAAILAVGAIKERPAVRGGQIVPAHLMSVTLSCDHRILYGAEGAQFLARIRALLEAPVSLAL